jgi:putative ABC transport system permease protein
MLKNYLKIAFRNILQHKAFALINVGGLAIGMASSIFILLWVQNELSYDKFHTKSEGIYRLTFSTKSFTLATSPPGLSDALKSNVPEVIQSLRLTRQTKRLVEYEGKRFVEDAIVYADSNFFAFFSFPLIQGTPKDVLSRPDGVVITEEIAFKYFGSENAIGKVLQIDNNNNVVVTGVLQDLPMNSHLQVDLIFPMTAILNTDDLTNNIWKNFSFYTYVFLGDQNRSTSQLARVEKLTSKLIEENANEPGFTVDAQLQPLKDIHLTQGLQSDVPGHGDARYVKVFFVVALCILIVACINYMNLATARSARRAKEVGLRKVVGAGKNQLLAQFLGESVLTSILALFIAGVLVFALLPIFNEIAGKKIVVNLLNWRVIASLLGMAIITGMISGSYPALFLSRSQPVSVIKGNVKTRSGNLSLRNALVVTQFVVSIILLAGTATVFQQLNFIRNMNLGYDKSNLLYMPMSGELWNKQQPLRTELSRNALTSQYAVVSDLPIDLNRTDANVQWQGKKPGAQMSFAVLDVSEGFFTVFQTEVLRGRPFSKEFASDTSNYVINEKAAKIMGYTPETAIGQSLAMFDGKGTIVGVVKDFNFKPAYRPIEPMILRLNKWGGIVVVRTEPGETKATIASLRNITQKLNPAFPFSYDFVDQDISRVYQGEMQMGKLFNVFALLAIVISSMGLYGLSAFIAEQRTKEIGVRKVLGASVLNLLYLLTSKFTKLTLLAILIAIPVAWVVLNNWLETFVYRINLSWYIFVSASLAALLLTWITVSYESIKAATANPVKSLRSK